MCSQLFGIVSNGKLWEFGLLQGLQDYTPISKVGKVSAWNLEIAS